MPESSASVGSPVAWCAVRAFSRAIEAKLSPSSGGSSTSAGRVPRIREVTAALTEDLIATLRAAGFTPRVAAEPERRSAIVMIPMPDPAAAVRHLAAGGVIVDSRPGHVRFSPFFYNVQDDNVRATERLTAQPAH